MINLQTFFKNHFDNDKIADDRLKAFSEDHINKLTGWLTVHVDATLSALLADLALKHNAYFGAITDEKTKFNIQQGRTIAADNAWNAALNFVRQKEGIIKGTWGKDSPTYQEFYPLGLDEYNHATKANKEAVLDQYLAAATAHSAELPLTFVSDFTFLATDWQTKFTAQQTQIGLVKDANSQTATVRDPLETQLMVMLLVIASKNAGHPEMVNDFFNQSLLQAPQFNLPKEGEVNPGALKRAVDLETFDPDFEIKLTNVSGGPLEFGLSLDGLAITGNTTTIASPGDTTVPLSYFGVNATIIMVRNQGAVVSLWRVARG